MRRFFVLAVITCLSAGAFAAPAVAKKKPIKFSTEGAFQIGNPADYMADAGLVRNEFAQTCAVPASQGTDGFVIELPAAVQKIDADAALEGEDATGGPDMDMYFYDEGCMSTGDVATTQLSEYGVVPAGTKWIVVSAWMGADVKFTLDLVEKKG